MQPAQIIGGGGEEKDSKTRGSKYMGDYGAMVSGKEQGNWVTEEK